MNAESSAITALILFFLLTPVSSGEDAAMVALAGVVAMASKYFLAVHGRHIFNPAAFGAAALGLAGWGGVLWWVGTPALLPFTLVFGLLLVRKIRREALFWACIAASFVTVSVLSLRNGMSLGEGLFQHLLSWPVVFFASVMVTEPLTTPPRLRSQILYGLFVGALSSWPLVIGPVYSTPELALLVANIYSFSVSLRRRVFIRLKEKREVARGTWEFVFDPDRPLAFRPGQYLEWTLGQAVPDSRGNRRYFTIASSPTEKEIRLGVRIGDKASAFKQALRALQPVDAMVAGNLGGDFTLPEDPARKIVLIAGGIGITPYRSMVRHLLDTGERRDITLLYVNRAEEDIAYRDLFDDAERTVGLRVIYLLTDPALGSPGDPEVVLREHVQTLPGHLFYLSGPGGMVDAYKAMLHRLGVPHGDIRTDYFPGF